MALRSRIVLKTLAVAVTAGMVLAACSSSNEADGGSSATSASTPSTATTSPSTVATTTLRPDGECLPPTSTDGEFGRPQLVQLEIEAGGNSYPVRLYVPGESSLAAENDGRYPVVLNWHGLGSDGFQQALLTDYETLAEAEGFVVVHPTGGAGSGSPGGGGLQTGWELSQFEFPSRDDLAMVEALIDVLVDDFCADPDRIYSTGMSNGGFFTSRLVCELADRIAAAVAVAGISHPDDCEPSRAVPLMAFHGTDDPVVPFDGGPSQLENAETPPEIVEFFDQIMPDELAEFADDFGCDLEPEVTEISEEVVATDYQGCEDGVPIRFVGIIGGGHTWPGALLGMFMTDALGSTTTDVSATREGWRFMSRFSLDGPLR